MTHASPVPFISIGQILSETVLPRLHRAQKLPLRVSCLGTISYAGTTDAECRDRTIPLGDAVSPEDAMTFAALRVARGDISIGTDNTLHFQPRLIVVQDNALGSGPRRRHPRRRHPLAASRRQRPRSPAHRR